MITLDGLTIAIDSIDRVEIENGLYYAYTKDFIKICITEEEYNKLVTK